MSIKRSLLMPVLGCLLVSLSACTSPEAVTNVALSNPSQQLTPTASVELLDDFPNRPYKTIARLETQGNEAANSDIFLLENMRAKARNIGASAIVVEKKSKEMVTGTESIYGPSIYRVLRGTAILFTDGN
ncbi:hypothetical protein Mmc1_3329 [Magnetococcus marinus MC-1]|uniref:Lipoprotein n=1 Tax=Magnetococcus marinus (strain ATCC BAA-1437 / JCM 17883 / MC-1) TaxID=156889 RepID=A0LCX2_MAGMM|nr:hypothetical protein [Magnetococcus marinus]ABK45815.1 hypothetical protein Mmc1_3329 [Magnetococcus marinus MC-1]